MSNRVTLAQLGELPIGEIANLPVEQLAMLSDEVAELKAQAKKYDDWLHGALTLRFSEAALLRRRTEDKNFGAVRMEVDGFEVVCDVPKKVEYDQILTKQGVEVLRSWGEDPAHYVQTEIKISEARWSAWPPAVRKVFEAARTVRPGKQSFKLIAKEAA